MSRMELTKWAQERLLITPLTGMKASPRWKPFIFGHLLWWSHSIYNCYRLRTWRDSLQRKKMNSFFARKQSVLLLDLYVFVRWFPKNNWIPTIAAEPSFWLLEDVWVTCWSWNITMFLRVNFFKHLYMQIQESKFRELQLENLPRSNEEMDSMIFQAPIGPENMVNPQHGQLPFQSSDT